MPTEEIDDLRRCIAYFIPEEKEVFMHNINIITSTSTTSRRIYVTLTHFFVFLLH